MNTIRDKASASRQAELNARLFWSRQLPFAIFAKLRDEAVTLLCPFEY